MKRRLRAAALGALGALAASLAAPALGQPVKMRPGLWEHTHTMTSQTGRYEQGMAEMQRQMANMPPDQRRMMEQMMKQQGVAMGPKGTSVRVCITKEDAERDQVPADEGCTSQVLQRSGATLKVKFSCAGPPPSSGESEITFQGPTAYTGRGVFTTTIDGKPERINMEQSGRWVAADCGTIKPPRR